MYPINLKHETFIREMIAHGDRRLAYQTAYPDSSPNAAYANAGRLLARPEIYERIQQAVALVEEQLQQELAAQLKDHFMELSEKRAYLARLIRGEEFTVKHTTYYGKVLTYIKEPTPTELLRAIELDTKLEAECHLHR